MGTKEIEAYDKIEVTIENDAIEKAVEIQPFMPIEDGKVQFLVIKSEKYGEELTYKVNETNSTNVIKLDALHVFIGTGAVGLLGDTPKILLFKNELPDSVSIEILVGRMAIK